MKYAFAGDRDVAVKVLELLLPELGQPKFLCLSGSSWQSHADELVGITGANVPIIRGKEITSAESLQRFEKAELDYFFFIHFPYLIPTELLGIPREGCINLHPAFLPHNRGWHTPSWAILEDGVAGATLHFMAEEIDSGDIIHQKRVQVEAFDTAHTLYKKIKAAEVAVFVEALPLIKLGNLPRKSQSDSAAIGKKREDLFQPDIQCIDLDQETTARLLLKKLRALTTNKPEEAAYFIDGVRKIRVTINFEVSGR